MFHSLLVENVKQAVRDACSMVDANHPRILSPDNLTALHKIVYRLASAAAADQMPSLKPYINFCSAPRSDWSVQLALPLIGWISGLF